jgi:multidrug efflux system outer membrane protein
MIIAYRRAWSLAILRRAMLPTLLAGALASCDLAPHYTPATMMLPDTYAGAGPWQRAHPQDTLPRGPWWTAFGNPTLDELEAKVGAANPDLAAAVQSLIVARNLAAEAESGLYPQLSAGFSPTENRSSRDRLFLSPNSDAPLQESSVTIDAAASWEVDLWDKISNTARTQKIQAQAAQAAVASLDLSLQAELANDYIALRGLDRLAHVYDDTISYYRTAVGITTMRLNDNIGSGMDEGRAQNQLTSAEAALTDTQSQRQVMEHAIASLVGIPASSFSLPDQAEAPLSIGTIPTGAPSTLLQRRPDVAEAERQMAAANANIGVARAAFYPDVNISAIAGATAAGFNLIDLPNSMWSVGSSIALPLFEGGLRRAQLAGAKADYERTRDVYRSTVLTAIQQVEDQLSLSQLLNTETAQLRQSEAAAQKVEDLSFQLYKVGTNNYLDVVVAQSAALLAEISRVSTETRSLQALINLVRALGGGWRTAQISSEHATLPFDPLKP